MAKSDAITKGIESRFATPECSITPAGFTFGSRSGMNIFYSDADIRIDTEANSVEDVAAEILMILTGFHS